MIDSHLADVVFDSIFKEMQWKILFDKLADNIFIKWVKKRDENSHFDYGGKKMEILLTKLCLFIDALGETFSEKYDRILEVEKEYGLWELRTLMEKWTDKRESEALTELWRLLNLSSSGSEDEPYKVCGKCGAHTKAMARYCPECGADL
ncbi:MAG: hypothetical protein ACFFEN_07960 [Candidatus Thorarchaeota archaeon]